MPPFARLLIFLACLGLALPAQAYTQADYDADNRAMDRLFVAGDYPGAEALLRAMIDKAHAEWGSDDPRALDAETALANTLREENRNAEALELFRSVYDRWLAAKGKDNFFTLRAGMNLGTHLAALGRAEEGLPLVNQAVHGAEVVLGPDDTTTVYWRYNLAGLFNELGYLPEARAAFATARDKLMQDPSDRARRLAAIAARQVARADRDMGENALSADGYAIAVPLIEVAYGMEHPILAETLAEYALVLFRTRDPGLPAVLDRADKVTTVALGADSVIAADILNVRALALATEGGPGSADFDKALALMRQAIALKEAQLSPRAKPVGKLKLDLAAMLADTSSDDDLRAALDLLDGAEAGQSLSRDFFYAAAMVAAERGVLTHDQAAARMFHVAQVAQGSAAATAAYVFGTRLALGQGAAAQNYRRLTDLRQEEVRLQDDLLVQATLPLAERDPGQETALRNRLAAIGSETDALEDAIAAEVPSLSDLTGDGVLALADAQAMLAPDEALVVVDLGRREGERHFIIALSRDKVDYAELLWTTDSFVQSVAGLRHDIGLQMGTRTAAALDGAAEEPSTFYLPDAQWLYAETLGKMQGVIGDKAHLYLDLRGPMAALPPHLLVVSDNGTTDLAAVDWLVRHQAVSVLPSVFSLKSIAMARSRPPAAEPLLAFADPSFDLPPEMLASLDAEGQNVLRGSLQPLPETADEVRAVAQVLGAHDDALRLGSQASEAALKSATLDRYRILHFATHGLVAGDVVGDTVLGEPALALTAGQGEDGFVKTSEILGLHLNADFVVLSACNTAVGNDPQAEALSGLAQAFFYAGARGLLVSHWPVESRSAAHLMTETFRLRAAQPGVRAAEAQRQAMLGMIDAPGGRWAHPAYWAPFVLVGSPD